MQTLGNTAVRALIEVMIFNSWATVYGTDGTLGIAETIIDSLCFPPPLLDSKGWNTFFPRQEFFSFQLQPISNKQPFYCIFHTSPQWPGRWSLSLLIIVDFPRFEIIVLGKSYFLLLTFSSYSLSSGQITYNFCLILKPKSYIALNKISNKNNILWSKNGRHQCLIL